jgi:hypothetical protein
MKLAIQMSIFICAIVTTYATVALTAEKAKAATAAQPASNADVSEYAMGSCQVRIANMFGGHFRIPDPKSSPRNGRYYLPETGRLASPVLQGFGIDCLDMKVSDGIESLLSIKQLDGRWLRKDRDDNWVPFEPQQHAQVFTFKGRNWAGTGLLVDDTTGDKKSRARILSFCLIHKAQALCGDTPIALLSKSEDSELPKVEAILQSIEFVDEASSANSNANTDSVAPGNPH